MPAVVDVFGGPPSSESSLEQSSLILLDALYICLRTLKDQLPTDENLHETRDVAPDYTSCYASECVIAVLECLYASLAAAQQLPAVLMKKIVRTLSHQFEALCAFCHTATRGLILKVGSTDLALILQLRRHPQGCKDF